MKNLLKTFNPTFNYNKMKNKKALIKKLIFALTFLGTISYSQNKVNASESPTCPDPTATTITSLFDSSDSTSFYSLTGEGFCRGTPDTYGVTVYKMGFCKKDPGNPTGSTPLEGQKPDYSSCTWAFESTTGAIADFSAGGSIDLPEAGSSDPAAGTYPHAVMLISKDFRIKGKYGPVAGKTYYSTSTFGVSSTNISDWGVTTAPLQSFSGPTECTASTEGEAVVGGTIDGYLLDSNGTMLVSDKTSGSYDTINPCTGHEKLLGVMNMANNLTISDTTKGLKMTFIVTNNGMSVMGADNGTSMKFDSGPFSVTFETF